MTSAGPLDGVTVLDFSQAMAGPFAAQKLGDLGASIIKIEPTGAGEWHRTRPAANAWVNQLNSSFIAFNRNKRSLSIDLKAAESRAIIQKLAALADVAIQNFRPGVAERLGIDYKSLRENNDRIIYCSMSGYGETGPYVLKPGQDLVLQGYSGAMWNTGTTEDAPLPSIYYACDAIAAHLAFEGVLAALFHRERTGVGQKVEVNMLNGVIDLQAQELSVYLTGHVKPQRPREPLAHALLPAPYGVYQTSDGHITVAMGPLPALGAALDNEWLRSLTHPEAGMELRDQIRRTVAAILPTRSSHDWLEILDAHAIWAGPVYDYDDLVADPQVRENDMIVEIDHPTEGRLRVTGIPLRFTESPGSIRLPPPLVGQHTDEILSWLGYSSAQITDLRAREVIDSGRVDGHERDRIGVVRGAPRGDAG
jgi:crotonobetainyl-CoA:carnitine CoA-transferase CaiB-like acyl-CoA transferase